MTRRDLFAAAALPAVIRSLGVPRDSADAAILATRIRFIVDALLESPDTTDPQQVRCYAKPGWLQTLCGNTIDRWTDAWSDDVSEVTCVACITKRRAGHARPT